VYINTPNIGRYHTRFRNVFPIFPIEVCTMGLGGTPPHFQLICLQILLVLDLQELGLS
jgi:hypothetical protein